MKVINFVISKWTLTDKSDLRNILFCKIIMFLNDVRQLFGSDTIQQMK